MSQEGQAFRVLHSREPDVHQSESRRSPIRRGQTQKFGVQKYWYIAPAPPVTISSPSQQLPLAYTMATTSLVNPRCSTTAVGDSAPHVVASLLPWTSMQRPCTTRSVRNCSSQRRRPRSLPSCLPSGRWSLCLIHGKPFPWKRRKVIPMPRIMDGEPVFDREQR